MNSSPMWYRKLIIREEGKFALLPVYVRGLGAIIKKYANDRGWLDLAGRSIVDAVARRCGAEKNEKRSLATDIQKLIDVGYLRVEPDALVVVEQEEEWERMESGSSGRRSPTSNQPKSDRSRLSLGSVSAQSRLTNSSPSSRNHSGADRQQEDRRETKERRSSPIGEGVQGEQTTETDPTPTIRKPNLDEVVGKGPAEWGMEGSGATQSDPAKAQPPTPRPAPPSPPLPRRGPPVAVVDPRPVQGQTPPAVGAPGRPATLVDIGPPNAPQKAPAKKSTAKRPQAVAAGEPLPEDWAPNETHYTFGRELGLQKKHVDYFAGEMRDRSASDGWVSGNWNAKFRNFMRKGLEFRKGEPPVVPEPLPPKVPMPPCPPPPPEVLERAEQWKKRMEAGEQIDLKSLFKPKYVVPPVKEYPELGEELAV
jgi:hypothetical protein